MKQYDDSKFRVLGIGERVTAGDFIMPLGRGHPGLMHSVVPGGLVDGHIVTDEIDTIFLRPIANKEAPAVPSRKVFPVATGVMDYFPDAIRAVAHCSWKGNEQHNPGKPMHWDRAKSGDEADCLMRHFLERGTMDTDGISHTTKVAWRALALLQKELEAAK